MSAWNGPSAEMLETLNQKISKAKPDPEASRQYAQRLEQELEAEFAALQALKANKAA